MQSLSLYLSFILSPVSLQFFLSVSLSLQRSQCLSIWTSWFCGESRMATVAHSLGLLSVEGKVRDAKTKFEQF